MESTFDLQANPSSNSFQLNGDSTIGPHCTTQDNTMSVSNVMGKMRTVPKLKDYKKLSRKQRVQNAWHRAVGKLGEEKIAETVETYLWAEENGEKSTVNEIILNLLSAGLSQIEVVAIIPVGGSRVSKLAKSNPEIETEKRERFTRHAASDEDKQAILNQIETWDIEPAFPCEHRLEFLVGVDEWQQLHTVYKNERCRSGKRALGIVRWREYVRAFRPRLVLKNAKSKSCSCRHNIEMEIIDPATTVQRKADLKLVLDTHDEAVRERQATYKFIAHYQEPQQSQNELAVEEAALLEVAPDLECTMDPENADSKPVTSSIQECLLQPEMSEEAPPPEREDEFQLFCVKEEVTEDEPIEGDECWIAESTNQDTGIPRQIAECAGPSIILRPSADDLVHGDCTGGNVSCAIPESVPKAIPLQSSLNVKDERISQEYAVGVCDTWEPAVTSSRTAEGEGTRCLEDAVGVPYRSEPSLVLDSSRGVEGELTGIHLDVVQGHVMSDPERVSESLTIGESEKSGIQNYVGSVSDGSNPKDILNNLRVTEGIRTGIQEGMVGVHIGSDPHKGSNTSRIAEGGRTGILDMAGVIDRLGRDKRSGNRKYVVVKSERSKLRPVSKNSRFADGKRTAIQADLVGVSDRSELRHVSKSSRILEGERNHNREDVGGPSDGSQPDRISNFEGITYKCSVCGKVYTKPCHLEIHLRTHNGVQLHKCFCCSQRFADKSKLKEHELRHAGGGPYHCAYCSLAFRKIRALKRHTIKHTGGKPFQCLICDDAFPTMACLQRHVTKHKPPPTYRCSDCNRCFSNQTNYKRHIREHSKDTPHPEKKGTAERRPHQCCICNKSFAALQILRRHIKCHTGQKPYQCSYCDKGFTANSSLLHHLRCHTGEKPHQCSVCGRCFTVKRTLDCHMRIHTGQKPFSCPICNKAFRNRSGRWSHMKRHSRENIQTEQGQEQGGQ